MSVKTWVSANHDSPILWKKTLALLVKFVYEGGLSVLFGFGLFAAVHGVFFITLRDGLPPTEVMYTACLGVVGAAFTQLWCRLSE